MIIRMTLEGIPIMDFRTYKFRIFIRNTINSDCVDHLLIWDIRVHWKH
uniref:Uncharacterized protein n=1 Tax=Tetranychus urticae TaxID=32264 RepID=T1KT14_TETUR